MRRAAQQLSLIHILCTQDKDHREHAVSALKKGYHLLLEKPVACTPEDCLEIERTAKELNRQVAVCHVLRYSLYYEKIKEIIESGILGKIIAIDQVENVAYWHQDVYKRQPPAGGFIAGSTHCVELSQPMFLLQADTI